MAEGNILTLTDANFDQEVLRANEPVLVDFWAEWCGPCKMLVPLLNDLAAEYQGRIKFGKVNVDEHQRLAGKYGITNIPTLLLFKSGEVTAQMVGLGGKRAYKEKLDQALA